MKAQILFSALLLGALTVPAWGQHAHSDIEFGYDSLVTPTEIEVEVVEATSEGFAIFESEFEELDPGDPGNFSADEPGFTTNAAESLLVNEDDQVWLSVLDSSTNSSFGQGFVTYYNPLTDTLEAAGRIAILDNTGSTSDLILNGAGIESGDMLQFLGLGDVDGDVHDHLVIDLLDDATAAVGAYGIMFQMHSDFDPADGNIDVSSDAFWIVANYGMDEEDFETLALPRFGLTVPEPGTASVLAIGTLAMMVRRRR